MEFLFIVEVFSKFRPKPWVSGPLMCWLLESDSVFGVEDKQMFILLVSDNFNVAIYPLLFYNPFINQMCLYSILEEGCHHTECKIAISIYMSSESYRESGGALPKVTKL